MKIKLLPIWIAIIAITGFGLTLLSSCKKDDPEPAQEQVQKDPVAPVYNDGQGEIGSLGGIIQINDESSPINGAFIEIPENSLPENTFIKVSAAPDSISFPGEDSSPIIQFEPKGLKFENPITIGIPFNTNVTDTSNLNIFYYDADSSIITQMPKRRIDLEKKIIIGETMHFSYYTVWDGRAKIDIEMLKIDNKIGVRLKLNDLDKISTRTSHCINTGLCNVWEAIQNSDEYNKSVFNVRLYRHRSLWVDDFMESKNIYVWRRTFGWEADAIVNIGYEHSTAETAYEATNISFRNPDSELAMWKSGEPLIFYFDDFDPDPGHSYFVKVKWFYSMLPVQNIFGRATPLYEFENKDVRMKLDEMTSFSVDLLHSSLAIDKSYISGEGALPVVATSDVANIASTSAIGGGNVTSQGSTPVNAHGLVWSTEEDPSLENHQGANVIGTGTGQFTGDITNLIPNTTYFVAAYASNSAGTSYGDPMEFTTPEEGNPDDELGESCPGMETVTDIDGNVYKTVLIGDQCWIRENLRTTKYQDGSVISYPGNNNTSWQNNTTGAYAWYDNDESWKNDYGALYNWHAVNNSNELCPAGWHVPTNDDWNIMSNYLDGNTGGKIKSIRTEPLAHPRWDSPNTDATNETGFTGIPGGARSENGNYSNLGAYGTFWTSIESSNDLAYGRDLSYVGGRAPVSNYSKWKGQSVRCIKTVAKNIPSSPSNVYAGDWNQGFGVYWKDNSDNETGFRIYKATNSLTDLTEYGTISANETFFADENNSPDNFYAYKVTAYNDDGESDPSNIAVIPKRPINLNAQINTSSITLSWSYPSDSQAERVYIHRSTSPDGSFGSIGYVSSPATSFEDTDVAQGVKYYYKVHSSSLGGADHTCRSLPTDVVGPFLIEEDDDNGDGTGDTQTQVVEVTNPTTGKTWMDRNLGASRAATSSTDAEAYGDLYQWGRAADGHQKRNSPTTSTLSSSDTPGHGDFITVGSSPYDWRSPQNDNLWQGVNGTNNPCPAGYRLPTEAELDAERQSWGSNNAAGAFASPLKLPVAGLRFYYDGLFRWADLIGDYWTSTVDGKFSRHLQIEGLSTSISYSARTMGFSVRCLKD